MPKRLSTFLPLLLAVALPGAGPAAQPVALHVVAAVPLATDLLDAAHASQLDAELARIREEIPAADLVALGFHEASTPRDWRTALDICQGRGFAAIVSFVRSSARGVEPLRPVRTQSGWSWSAYADFVADPALAFHPALFAVFTIDEPWHERKLPRYTTADLQDMYVDLKSRAPRGAEIRILVQFSREIARYSGREPGIRWERGICDIVQISALEFQNGRYQRDLLDYNHSRSREIIHAATPEIPLLTSVQVMGARYGPSPGYWFPRERDGFSELTTLLSDLFSLRYESRHRLAGIYLQNWDSVLEAARPGQYTLGDRDPQGPRFAPRQESDEFERLPRRGRGRGREFARGEAGAAGPMLTQQEAATDARAALRRWLADYLAGNSNR